MLQSQPDLDALKTRFTTLWARCGLDRGEPSAREVLARLLDLYSEPHRHYHNLHHIRHCLNEFNPAAVFMEEPDAVELALWFHDAIYLPGAADNERRSADLFRAITAGRADARFQQRIDDLIMVTCHRELPSRRDEQFIVDIDLSGFGLPWETFIRDGFHIRAEFPDVSDNEYYPRHLRFLQGLSKRPSFFLTDWFRQRYEQTARENIQKLITELSRRGYF